MSTVAYVTWSSWSDKLAYTLFLIGPFLLALTLRAFLPRRLVLVTTLMLAAMLWMQAILFAESSVAAGVTIHQVAPVTEDEHRAARDAITSMTRQYEPLVSAAQIVILVLTILIIIDAFRIKRLMLTSPGDVRRPRHATRRAA